MAKKRKKKGLPIPPGRGNTTEELIDLLKHSKLKITVEPDTRRGFEFTQGRGFSIADKQGFNVAKRQRGRRQQLRNFRRRGM